MRDHRKLKAFEAADDLVFGIYRWTKGFPAEERYGLSNQLRRAAVSITGNIVEGSARSSEREYFRFLEMSFSSSCEVKYQLGLALRLEFGSAEEGRALELLSQSTTNLLARLLQYLERDLQSESSSEVRGPKSEVPPP